MKKSLTVRMVDGVWFKVEDNDPTNFQRSIFNDTNLVNNFGDEDSDGYEVNLGVDGNWYEVNDSQTPMFQSEFDKEEGNPEGSSLIHGRGWVSEATDPEWTLIDGMIDQPIEELVTIVMGWVRYEKVTESVTLDMVIESLVERGCK